VAAAGENLIAMARVQPIVVEAVAWNTGCLLTCDAHQRPSLQRAGWRPPANLPLMAASTDKLIDRLAPIHVSRWRIAAYMALGVGFVFLLLTYAGREDRTGYVLSGGIVALAGIVGGESGIRFLTPLGIALGAGWLVGSSPVYSSFYSTTAQVIPILVLAVTVEQRGVFRDEARGRIQVAVFLLTLTYMLIGEYAALHGAAICDPAEPCHDPTSAPWTVRGLAGGFASMVVVALLPRPGRQSPRDHSVSPSSDDDVGFNSVIRDQSSLAGPPASAGAPQPSWLPRLRAILVTAVTLAATVIAARSRAAASSRRVETRQRGD
jgi:hypothetical protein